MPNTLSPATSGRAKCRGCGRTISKGELRFGEGIPNAYGEGETFLWFHVPCAALMRPEPFAPYATDPLLTEAARVDVAELVSSGIAHPRLARVVRAERASSGRAHCRHCREIIGKGVLRIALQLLEESHMTPIGFIHVACANGYFGTRDTVHDRIRRSSDPLSESDDAELAAELAKESPPAAPREPSPEDVESREPGLAKTRPENAPSDSAEADIPRRGSA